MRNQGIRPTLTVMVFAFTAYLATTGAALATEKGWYLGFAVGQSELVEEDAFDSVCSELFVVCGDTNSSTAFKAIVGYQFNNYLGVEGAFFDLGDPGIATEAPIVVEASVTMSGGSFSILPQIPIGSIGALFGRLGVAAGDVEAKVAAPIFETGESDSTTAGTLVVGAGGAINLGRNATIRVEWERYAFDETLELAQRDVDTPNVDVFSASIVFRFPKN